MKMLLVATWKAWTVPILVIIGLAGCVIRGLMDMFANFETGYGADSIKAKRQAFAILIVFVLAAILLGFFGCGFIEGVHQFDNNPNDRPATSLNKHDHFKERNYGN